MPQWRKLHVKATESLDINEMPDDFHRLLWVMLPLGLDREGRGLDNPAWVKAKIMPLRTDVTPVQIEAALIYFAAKGMIDRYEVDGRKYFHIPTWTLYQGNTSKEAASNYPDPSLSTNSRPTPDLLQSGATTDSDADVYADSIMEGEEEAPSQKPNAFKVYEQEIGAITPKIADRIKLALEDHPENWVIEAMNIASVNGKRSWAYAEAILKRWEVDGYGSEMKKANNGKPSKKNEPGAFEALRQLEQEGWFDGE